MIPYTPKQITVMKYIRDYTLEKGCCPTYAEIGEHLGVSTITVFEHVKTLVSKGALRKIQSFDNKRTNRAIEILDLSWVVTPANDDTKKLEEIKSILKETFSSNSEDNMHSKLVRIESVIKGEANGQKTDGSSIL